MRKKIVIVLVVGLSLGSAPARAFLDWFWFDFYWPSYYYTPYIFVPYVPTITIELTEDQATAISWSAANPRQVPGSPNFSFASVEGDPAYVPAGQKVVQCLREGKTRSTYWKDFMERFVLVDYRIVFDKKACNASGDFACVGVDPQKVEDRPYMSRADVARTRSGPILIEIDPDSIKNRLDQYGDRYTAEQIIAEIIIHEMGHVMLYPGDGHGDYGPEQPQFKTEGKKMYDYVKKVYVEVFGERPPLISVGDGSRTTKSEIPLCLGGTFEFDINDFDFGQISY